MRDGFSEKFRRLVTIERSRQCVATVVLLVGSIGMVAAGESGKTVSDPISKENWTTHSSLEQAMAIAADVTDGIDSGKIGTEEIVYDITSEKCLDHIVTISETIGLDGNGTARYYKKVHFVAHEAVGFSEYFLDEGGVTRFLYVSLDEDGWQNSRAYFDESGKGIFSIEQIDGEYLEDRMSADEYVRFTSDRIKQAYKLPAECPVAYRNLSPTR